MASNRVGKAGKVVDSTSSSTKVIVARHRSSEATHVLLRELSTQKLVIIPISCLSDAARMKSLSSGRNVSYRDGNGRGQKQGTILIVSSHDDVLAELNNQTSMNLTNSSQDQQYQVDSFEKNYNNQHGSVSKSSISVESSFVRSLSSSLVQSDLSQDVDFPSLMPTLSPLDTLKTATSNSSPSECSTIVINETSMHGNMIHATGYTTAQDSSSVTPGLAPLKRAKVNVLTNQLTLRAVVPSTTTRLQSLVNSKDDEISKQAEQIKKFKLEVEKNAEYSIFIPTDEIVINWVDYLYESIHKTEIRNQVDLDAIAIGLNIERDTLDLCLELSVIREEHCWHNIDENIIFKICRFVREFFGVSHKFNDDYVRESLANMMRKDSWKFRNPDKSKPSAKQLSSTSSKAPSKKDDDTNSSGDGVIYVDDKQF
ncbi:unnamed protein product [Rotaria socialis]|uniref:Uncharacterized protein n=1 Tax=Rotaria socialis TaxID=392032 RepID=A0A817LVI8_9BILA|nr:unnamed protein product [Rotaria socialis]CAF4238191.1 unnamed protein product [Rotaria socialis]CAF4486702.1 unnamed protein product [Rotaria socialis]